MIRTLPLMLVSLGLFTWAVATYAIPAWIDALAVFQAIH